MVRFSLFPTPLGDCGIAWCGDTVIATRLPERTSADTGGRLAARTSAKAGEPPPAIRSAITSITALLEGERTDLTFITCDFSRIDPFATKVYMATRAIPAGETLTYGAIALQIGNKQLAQNVGRLSAAIPFRSSSRVIASLARTTGSPAFRRTAALRRSSGCSQSRALGLARRRGCLVIFRWR
jgi:methylated-DNA-[protein]-cysteine S-methyltransferase